MFQARESDSLNGPVIVPHSDTRIKDEVADPRTRPELLTHRIPSELSNPLSLLLLDFYFHHFST
jgi:hypothetical protein